LIKTYKFNGHVVKTVFSLVCLNISLLEIDSAVWPYSILKVLCFRKSQFWVNIQSRAASSWWNDAFVMFAFVIQEFIMNTVW